MLQRPIPSTGELLPVIGLGTWQQFDVGTTEEKAPLKKVLQQLAEGGGKLIDSSPMYARSEEITGELTQQTGLADTFFYASKVWTTGKQKGIDQMNASYRKMKRQTMDLMQVHNLVDWQTHIETMREWKGDGKLRYIGITHYTDSAHAQLEQVIKTTPIDFVQFNYSISSRNAEKSLLNTAKEKGVAVIINEPLEKGSLYRLVSGKQLPAWAKEYDITNWTQFFLKYILSHEAVNCVIPGTSNPQHLHKNLSAGNGRMPNEAARKKMVRFMESL